MTEAGSAGTSGGDTIRLLVPDDWRALRSARLAALSDAPYAFSSTLERELGLDEARWRERILGSAFFTAWRDGQIIGMACGIREWRETAAESSPVQSPAGQPAESGPVRPPAESGQERPRDSRSWHLVSMWVCPEARGSGVADRLVAAVCERAAADGADRVELWVTDVNARARAFYARLGFGYTGRRQPVRPDDSAHWEQEMARDLR